MVNVPGSLVQPLLTCLEDCSSQPEARTDACLRLAEDLAKEDEQYVKDVCNFSARLLSALSRDILSERTDLSHAALQAVGYCIYHDKIVSSLQDTEMSMIIQDLCNTVMNSTDKNLCTRALWGIAKQHLYTKVIIEKLHVILNTVEYALLKFDSTMVKNEALEVIYRLISDLPSDSISSTAGKWSKLVYPLLICSAHKVREKALGILELGLKLILLMQKDVVTQLLPDLKGGLLSELVKLFSDKKEVFVLRAWTVIVTILGETLHKNGSLINDMLKVPEQGFKSPLPNVQSMSYTAWICLIDNFAISPVFLTSQKKIKLLMMPLTLHPGKIIHKDIELGRLHAWWHLICAIKPEHYSTETIFSEVCLPLLQYYFNVNVDASSIPLGNSKDGLQELTMPVTPVAHGLATPSSNKSIRNTPKRKSVIFNKEKFPEAFVRQIMQLGYEMLMEILATNSDEVQKNKRLTEHLQNPILTGEVFREHLTFFLAVVKSALHSCASFLEVDRTIHLLYNRPRFSAVLEPLKDELIVSIWSSMVSRIVTTLLNHGDRRSVDEIIAPLFFTTNDVLTCCSFSPSLVLRFLDVLGKVPAKYLLHSVRVLSFTCRQGKPVFLLADILFSLLSNFKESYVDERFHTVFENLIDIGFEAPSGKLTTVYNVWLILEGMASTVANVEDIWRFWSKVTDSVREFVSKTSDVDQGDSLEPDFSLMISLLSFPFKQLLTGGLPVATTKELDGDVAEFFQLFSRSASLVQNAEANTSIEELSKSLVTIVTLEKCKNVKYLDSISGLICVMMDCVDFSSQNICFTPGGSYKRAENLGNLGSLAVLSSKVLNISYRLDKEFSGSAMVAPAVTVLAGTLSKLFASLNNPQHIKLTIRALSPSISAFISHYQGSSSSDIKSGDKKSYNSKYILKIEKLWTDILMCLQSRYTAAFDSKLLEIMSELLGCTLCHQRRQFKNQTIMFWNATFGQASHLDYPDSLRDCLQTVSIKTPLNLPGWNKTKVASYDFPPTSQDSEETTPKDSFIKQDVITNSPKKRHGGSSPGKLKGSFLYKALNSDKTERLSPLKKSLEPGNKRKSPGTANVRRKLPLPLDTTEDKDFVVIAPSPKKKRLLTEHQKEVRKTKKLESGHPALYNMLDQSQDGTQFSELSQSMLPPSLSHPDVETPIDKNVIPGSPEVKNQNENEVKKKLDSPFQTSIRILLDKKSDGRDQVALPNNISSCTSLETGLVREKPLDNFRETLKTLPGGSDCFDNEELIDDDRVPPSQTSSSTSSKKTRRCYTQSKNHTLKNKNLLFSRDCSKIVEMKSLEAENMDLERENVPLLTDIADCSMREETNIAVSSEVVDIRKDVLETSPAKRKETSPETKKKRPSPVSSRTRFRKKPTPGKDKPLTVIKEKQAKIPHDVALTEMNELADPVVDDTQILPESPVQVTGKEIDNKMAASLPEVPSSPSANSSVKFVSSNKSASGSPLYRPARSLSSPACSPTTGILKRNRGKADTPSPSGKARRVSFAFPLKEEKEINLYPLDRVDEHVQVNHPKTNPSSELANSFTSIGTTSTKPSTPSSLKEDCVFPDLVECTTPVEQILPSLATLRWSRGLVHVVHAQNIRTVGNLSSLTKDQVEMLPIRSPKVSTLRRVLRNFHESRPKTSEASQPRAIEDLSENAETEGDVVLPDLAKSEELYYMKDDADFNKNEAVAVTPSSSSRTDADKMLTPKRFRSFVKPTTLFESSADIEQNGGTDDVASEELDIGDMKENEIDEQEQKTRMDDVKTEMETSDGPAIILTVDNITEKKTLSVLNKTVAINTLLENTLLINVSDKIFKKISCEELPENPDEEPKQENREMAVPNSEISKLANQEMLDLDIPKSGQLKSENQGKLVEEVLEADQCKPQNQEIPIVDRQEMPFIDVSETGEFKPEYREMAVQVVRETEESECENQDMVVLAISAVDEPNQKNLKGTAEEKQEIQEIVVGDLPAAEDVTQENLEIVGEDMNETKEAMQEKSVDNAPTANKEENDEMAVEDNVEDAIDPCLKALHEMLTLKSQQEINKLPLHQLLSCQERLATVLSNTTTAIRLKCEPGRK